MKISRGLSVTAELLLRFDLVMKGFQLYRIPLLMNTHHLASHLPRQKKSSTTVLENKKVSLVDKE